MSNVVTVPALAEVMYGKFTRLSHTYRYSAAPVLSQESVAEHSFWTALIGMTIAIEIDQSPVVGNVAAKAILHDIEECMTGDLVREMKYATPEFRESIRSIEVAFISSLVSDMGWTGIAIKNRWSNAKDNTMAGRIVDLADALSVIAYCTKEYTLGNRNLDRIRLSCVDLIEDKFRGDKILMPLAASAIQESFRRWP